MLIMSYCVNQVIIENALFSYFIRAFVPPAGVCLRERTRVHQSSLDPAHTVLFSSIMPGHTLSLSLLHSPSNHNILTI